MKIESVPRIDARYWGAILAASMCGTNAGDFAARTLGLGHIHGLAPLAIAFALIIFAESRIRGLGELWYWLAIIVLRTGATNVADLMTHDLALGYGMIELGLTALLIALIVLDRGPASASAQRVPSTTLLYWLTMFTAGTLGTATGDWISGPLGFGDAYGSVVLLLIFAATLAAALRLGGLSKPWYWAVILAARSAGTTLGDLLASRHGAGLGLTFSLILTGLLLLATVGVWPALNRRVPRAA